VSDPTKQDEHSPEHEEAWLRNWLENNIQLPFSGTLLAGSGSEERLKRAEYVRLLELVESERFDLVLTEDLGRIVRRIHAHLVCELCVDHETRLISLNDHVDTAEDG
jgi:site-specific DNA recombinase